MTKTRAARLIAWLWHFRVLDDATEQVGAQRLRGNVLVLAVMLPIVSMN